VKKISESEHNTNTPKKLGFWEYPKTPRKYEMSKSASIISTIICLTGGINFMLSSVNLRQAVYSPSPDVWAMFFGVVVIIGALMGLKYHLAGYTLSLSMGLISTLSCWASFVPMTRERLCVLLTPQTPLYFYGTLFTVVGSAIGLILVNKISESEQRAIKITRKTLFQIISSCICLIGGAIFIWAGMTFYYNSIGVFLGVLVLFGAITGLKYRIGGGVLCLFWGWIASIACQGALPPTFFPVDCLSFSPIFLFGTILTVIGSIVGITGGILKLRENPKKSGIWNYSKKKTKVSI
jgi:hypothetical protein